MQSSIISSADPLYNERLVRYCNRIVQGVIAVGVAGALGIAVLIGPTRTVPDPADLPHIEYPGAPDLPVPQITRQVSPGSLQLGPQK